MNQEKHCPKCFVEHSPAFCPERLAPEITKRDCKHENFVVKADVNRLIDSGGFMADIRVDCSECGLPFEFVGVNAGLSFQKPMADVTGQVLRAPLRPKGQKIMPAIPGFEVRVN